MVSDKRTWLTASFSVRPPATLASYVVLTGDAAAFNQTEMGRQQGGKGTGLGLALVRQIVKLSGGRLGLRSKVNEGSTFWVELRKCIVAMSHVFI